MQGQGKAFALTPRMPWARIWALAWLESDKANLLEDIRKDPKSTITQLKEGTKGEYKELLESLNDTERVNQIIQAADEIIRNAGSLEEYTGFLPIPSNPFGKFDLKEDDIKNLLRSGLEGILRFDDQADVWAEVLFAAWGDQDSNLLKDIRQDPEKGLKSILGEQQVKELQESKYGILPLPDKPDGLDKDIEKLTDFLGDEDNADHIGGIFALT